jgi:phosphatidylglycerol:prolipoprotein diacylglycerol transferase
MYYLAMFLGYVAMVVLMLLPKRRALYRLSRPKSVLFATAVLIAGLLGCKILYIIECFDYVLKHGLTIGGFSFFGAALLVPLLMLLVGKAFKLSPAESLDNSAVCVVAMLGTIRIGCFCNGCCGGRIFFFKNFDFSFPTQLIELVCDALILVWLLRTESRPGNRGRLYGRFLLSYGIARFFIEFLRSTPKDWLGLSHGQWFALIAIIAGAVAELIYFDKRVKLE